MLKMVDSSNLNINCLLLLLYIIKRNYDMVSECFTNRGSSSEKRVLIS